MSGLVSVVKNNREAVYGIAGMLLAMAGWPWGIFAGVIIGKLAADAWAWRVYGGTLD